MGKTKEMLIEMQEETAMNLPSTSSNTLSEPAQALNVEVLMKDIHETLSLGSFWYPKELDGVLTAMSLPNQKVFLKVAVLRALEKQGILLTDYLKPKP